MNRLRLNLAALFLCCLLFGVGSCSEEEGVIRTTGSGDTTSPSLPADDSLVISNLAPTSLTLAWGDATDDQTDQILLEYLAYYSTSNNLTSVDNIESNGTAIGDYQVAVSTVNVSGLSSTTQYYFNVIVRDEAGNKQVYSSTTAGTSATGVRDTDFNGSGYAMENGIAGGNGADSYRGMVIDSKGRIIVVGQSIGASNMDAVILRYQVDGSLDTSFSGDGILSLDNIGGSGGADSAAAVAVDSSDRILVTGYTVGTFGTDMFLIRLTEDGSADSSFGSGGVITHDDAAGGSADNNDYGGGVTVDDDGKILVTGQSDGVNAGDMALWRYTSAGILDSTFGTNGIVTSNSAAGGSGLDSGYKVLVDSSDRILVAGYSFNGSNDDLVLWRYDKDGSADTSFGSAGILVHNNAAGGNGNDQALSLAVDRDNKLVATGYSHNGTNLDMVIWRFNSDGSLDTSFNTTGYVIHDNAGGGNGSDKGNDVVLDAGNNIIVAGLSFASGSDDAILWRYSPDGTLDNTLDSDGVYAHSNGCGPNASAAALGLLSSGRLVAAGACTGSNSDQTVWMIE